MGRFENAEVFRDTERMCREEPVGTGPNVIAGQPLVSWRHDRGPMLARRGFDPCDGTDDGIVVARWGGGIRCLVNLGDVPRTVEGVDLEPYGYRIETP